MKFKQNSFYKSIVEKTELIIYICLILISYPRLNLNEIYFVFALVFLALISYFLNPNEQITFIFAVPLLILASEKSSDLPFAFISSVLSILVARKIGPGRLIYKLNLWKIALLCLLSSLIYLVSWNNPNLAFFMNFDFFQLTTISIQILSMSFFLNLSAKSFTDNEAIITSQLLSLGIDYSLKQISSKSNSTSVNFLFLQVIVLIWFTFWIFQLYNNFPQAASTKLAIALIFFILLFFLFPNWNLLSLYHVIFVLQSFANMNLIYYWSIIFLGYFILMFTLTKNNVSLNNKRKSFHILSLFLFLPAMILDPIFLRSSFLFALSLFLLVEFVRWSKLFGQQVSDFLTKAMKNVSNSRDLNGPLTLSHIYLLIGCGFPLLFFNDKSLTLISIQIMTGPLLVLAVGDTFASIIGKKYGHIKWATTSKTLEGTLAGIISTLFSAYILQIVTNSHFDWKSYIIGCILTFILEGVTHDIDNIILPIFFLTTTLLIK